MIAISSGTGPRIPLDGISRRSASEMVKGLMAPPPARVDPADA